MSTCSKVNTARRYYLLKAQAAASVCDSALELTWRAKQQAEPATTLPTDFPVRAALVAAHYTTVEDLTGAGTDELIQEARITKKQAESVIVALASL